MIFTGIRITVALILFGINGICSGQDSDKLDIDEHHLSVEKWFQKLNLQLKSFNHLTAYFAWELSTNPTDDLTSKSFQFNKDKSKWINKRCSEIEQYSNNLNETYQLMVRILCSGPKFTTIQTNELSNILYKMEEIFTETQICLPVHYDICLNLDRIWEFTYIKKPKGNIERLNMEEVAMKRSIKSKLNYYTVNNSNENYILEGNNENMLLSNVENEIRSGPYKCFNSEPDLDRFMEGDFKQLNRNDCSLRFNEIFRWTWESWRLAVGPDIGTIYPFAVKVMNNGAKHNGYNDIGEVWRSEMQLPNLRQIIETLLKRIKPFYKLLHGIVRNVLWKRTNQFEKFRRDGPIPAHLLGSMWAQNWQLYKNLVIPFLDVDLEKNLQMTNWTGIDMVKHADDFYSSMGLPMMTDKFWKNSHFQKDKNLQNCHGTAANMFDQDDYRMIVCAERTFNDLYVIIHEMGHIHYYMAFVDQPTIFQDANTALQESIGDALYMGFMTPHHLNRLRLLPDQYLSPDNLEKFDQSYLRAVHSTAPNSDYKHFSSNNPNDGDVKDLPEIYLFGRKFPKVTEAIQSEKNYESFKNNMDRSMNSFDLSILLQMALMKIPQIPFEFIIDVFRWDLFSNEISMDNANDYFWKLAIEEQGIFPPDWKDRHKYFDAGAKFHVADNTPFVRYFLASFIQAQIFRGLCEVTVYGKVTGKPLPMPMHRCDIYGSKRVGKLLKKALKIGQSQSWTEALHILTGSYEVSADALLEYYQPLIRWMEKIAIEFDVPIGWD